MQTEHLTVAGLTAAPGECIAQHVTITVVGVAVELPLFLINGAHPGPTLVVTAGIHGSEYPCVEAAARLGQTLDPAALHGQMIILPSANPLAFRSRSIYVTPPDGKNLNRQFPGSATGTFTEAWAYWLFQHIISQGDYYIDLHGGDMIEALVPFVSWLCVGNAEVDEAARAMADTFGISYILEIKEPLAGTTFCAAAEAGIPALLAEAGGQGVWDETSVAVLQNGVRRVMAHLNMYEPIAEPGEPPVQLKGWSWLRSEVNGLYYPEVAVGEQVKAGQDVGRIADVFGNTLQSITAPADGVVLFLVTSLAINTGDPLMAIAY